MRESHKPVDFRLRVFACPVNRPRVLVGGAGMR